MFWYTEISPSLRDVHLVALDRCVVAVVAMMGNPPAEVGSPKERVGNLDVI